GRRVDRGDSREGRYLAAVRLPPLRDEEGAVQGGRQPMLSADARALSAGGGREARPGGAGSNGRRVCERAASGPDSASRTDAGLCGLRGRRDPRGRPQRLRRPRRVRGTSLGPAARDGRPFLRDRNAAERDRIDGAPGARRALGRATGRRIEGEVRTFYFGSKYVL